MAISFVNSTTAFSSAGTQTPTVAVPAGAVAGDYLIAGLIYAGNTTVQDIPAGWTLLGNATLATFGQVSLVWRIMGSGVTQAQWTLTASGDGTYSKMVAGMVAYRGVDDIVLGTAVNRSSTASTTVAPSVTTTEAGETVVGFYVDRVSSQTSVTADAAAIERAKYINGGGGGASLLFTGEPRASTGATGTRTTTYGVASGNAYGVQIRLSPATGSAAPVVNAGADATSASGAVFSRTATATDADGTIASRLWTKTSGPTVTLNGSTTATLSVTPTTPGTYVFRHTATDNSGATGFDEFTLYVTSTTARPDGTITNPGNWVSVGGAGSLEAALADETNATYAETPASAVGAAVTYTLTPLPAGQVTVATIARSSTTPVITMRTQLLQGATVIATWDDVTTTSFATYSHTTTTGETAAITDFNALRVTHTWLS